MKILVIRGCNIASLEGEFEIDFTKEPLSSAGIFAITGATGSGKSTILDTICLSLFDTTPRIKNAENEKIIDNGKNLINLGKSGNALRRGTSMGYAEVDFIALDGNTYRSRWTIKRAHNKGMGKLQDSQLNVWNVTNNEEVQGTKTELLRKIVALIGLTFDQFTRAVLLAQGDFATFLKAEKKEKADLLEKLTGTDIYSQISKKIYEKYRESENEYKNTKQKIDGTEIIEEIEFNKILEEKKVCESALSELIKEEKLINDQLNWIEQNNKIELSITEAKNQHHKYTVANNLAINRFELLTRIDSIQEIRDKYREKENQTKELATNKTRLTEESKKKEDYIKEIERVKKEVELSRYERDKKEQEWNSLQPEIIKARESDILIEEKRKRVEEKEQECEVVVKECTNNREQIDKLSEQITTSETRLINATKWFDENSYYTEISPRYSLLINQINDCLNCKKQIEGQNEIVTNLLAILDKEKTNLVKAHEEEDRLNKLLPSEVAKLRADLIEGEPCAVCGSIHHPITLIETDVLAEEELTKKREECAAEIKRIETSINDKEKSIAEHKTLIKAYGRQFDNTKESIANSIANYHNWEMLFDNNSLANEITTKENSWQKSLIERTKLEETLRADRQTFDTATIQQKEKEEVNSSKRKELTLLQNELLKSKNERNILLNGQRVVDIEKELQNSINNAKTKAQEAEKEHNSIAMLLKELDTTIQLTEKNITNSRRQITELEGAISEWISSQQNKITTSEIDELLSYDNNWITREREELNELKNSLITSTTTLKERENNSIEHKKGVIKDLENLSGEELKTKLNNTEEEIKNRRAKAGEFDIAINLYNTSKNRIKEYEKELKKRQEILNNWSKLNELFGSADGAKFRTIAQGYTLDVLLTYANMHLDGITKRYKLERISPESLSLQVIDYDMLSEIRSVNTLSGGESFLISLALALGLSSLSSNRIKIESLFIDEGFGTLDSETLRTAMDVLESLQQTQGRKIGVISHVAEMTERITTQINVEKIANGSSQISIEN